MEKRLDLQELLEQTLGSPNVYYQPPPTVRMSYPAIVYSRDNISRINANNLPYSFYHRYSVTVIDRNPDSYIVEEVAKLPCCIHERHYTADNLNHDVFSLYYY